MTSNRGKAAQEENLTSEGMPSTRHSKHHPRQESYHKNSEPSQTNQYADTHVNKTKSSLLEVTYR